MKAILITAATLAALIAAPATAQTVRVGIGPSIYTSEQLSQAWQARAEVGSDLYGFAQYERTDAVQITQRLGRVDLYGVGAGYRVEASDSITLSIDGGYYEPDQHTRERTLSEIIYYRFTGDFGKPPFEGPNSFYSQQYTYNLDGGIGVTAAVEVEVTESLSLRASYRQLSLSETFTMRRDSDPCGCHWAGEGNRDFSGASMMVVYGF